MDSSSYRMGSDLCRLLLRGEEEEDEEGGTEEESMTLGA